MDSAGGSPPPPAHSSSSTTSSGKFSSPGFPYYFRKGRRNSKSDNKVQSANLAVSSASSSRKSSNSKYHRHHHRGSNSDPEGRTEFMKTSGVAGIRDTSYLVQSESERESELEEEFSPAKSSVGCSERKSSWKQCSGSLDSILSKEEPKRSPARRLMLPRFSSFVQKRTRMGFMRKRSPKPTTSTTEKDQS